MKPAVVGILIGIPLGLGVWAATNHFAGNKGAAQIELKQGEDQVKKGEKTLQTHDTIYKRDTIRLTREVRRYETLKDTIKLTDTVWVKEFVAQADSTIQACKSVVKTCEQKELDHVEIEAGLRRQNASLQKLVPGRTEKIITAVKWLGTGYLIGRFSR